jgi:hypothetical protein
MKHKLLLTFAALLGGFFIGLVGHAACASKRWPGVAPMIFYFIPPPIGDVTHVLHRYPVAHLRPVHGLDGLGRQEV